MSSSMNLSSAQAPGRQAQALCRRYCRRVRRSLFCPAALRRPVLSQLEESVLLYLEEHPGAGMSQLCAHFGTPKAFAEGVLENMEGEQLRKQLTRYRWRRVLAAVLITLALVHGVFYCARLAIDYICYPGYGALQSIDEGEAGPLPTMSPIENESE